MLEKKLYVRVGAFVIFLQQQQLIAAKKGGDSTYQFRFLYREVGEEYTTHNGY